MKAQWQATKSHKSSKHAIASSATERFKEEPYDGDKIKFQDFENEVKTVVGSKCGHFGLEYLGTDWPIDGGTGLPTVSSKFKVMEVPESLDLTGAQVRDGRATRAPTLDEKKDRREQVKAVNDFNGKIEDMTKEVSAILTERVTSDLNTKNLEYKCVPIFFWHYLKSGCSKEQLTKQDIGEEFIKSLSYEMEHEERFKAWLTKFDQKTELCQYSEEMKLGLLLTNGDNKLGINILPSRLDEAVQRCKLDNLEYTETVKYITTADEKSHQRGIGPKSNKSKVHAVGHSKQDNTDNNSVLCYNCNNYCHNVYHCRLDACGSCRKFGVGHKCNECPVRLAKEAGKGGGDRGRSSERGRGRGRGRGGRGSSRSTGGRGEGRGDRERGCDSYDNKKRTRSNSRDTPHKSQRHKSSDYDDEDDDEDYSDHKSKYGKQRVQGAVKSDNGSSYSQYSEDDYDDDYDSGDMEEEVVYVPKRGVRAVTKVQKLMVGATFKPRRIKHLCDSGAEDHCNPPAARSLLSNFKEYNDQHLPDVELVGPSGEALTVTGKGDVNKMMTNVYEVDNLLGDEGICSLQRLRSQGMWSIIPPRSVCPQHAVIICDGQGQVQLMADKQFYTDITTTGTYDISIDLPDISHLTVTPPTRRVRPVYGLEDKGIEDIVDFVYQSFLLTKKEMIWLASGGVMDRFPITTGQARTYYKTQPCKVAGYMQMRKSDRRQFASDEELEDSPTVRVAHDDNAVLDQDRLQVGRRVGSDLYGPYMNVTASCFQDYASGFGKSTFVTHSTKKGSAKTSYKNTKKGGIPGTLKWARGYFKRFKWDIEKLTTDSDKIYASKDFEEVCAEPPPIEQVMSPPEDHASNGHIESYNR